MLAELLEYLLAEFSVHPCKKKRFKLFLEIGLL